MKLNANINSLIRLSLLTSPVIGLLISFSPFKHISFSISAFLISVFVGTVFSLIIWFINIFLVYLNEPDNKPIFSNNLRFILSYLLNVSIITSLFLVIKWYVFNNNYVEFTETPLERNGVVIPLIIGFLLNSIVLVIEESVLMKNKKIMVELENAQLRIKNAEASYLQLKQQIHPHFLFNSLNILKTLIKKHPDTAIDYIIKLSNFLRVAISSNNSNTVKLEDELKLCFDYLEMQKIRFGKALEFSIDITEQVRSQGFVPVFAIQLLLENAIKHNSLTDPSPLKIKVIDQGAWITVSNNLQPKSYAEISTGLGLTNLSERYKILSDGDIDVQANDKSFSVSIKILAQ